MGRPSSRSLLAHSIDQARRSGLSTASWLALLALLFPTGCNSSDKGVSRLRLPDEALDLGVASPGQELHGTLVAANAGREVLRLGNIVTGCDCAGVVLPKRVLQPGEAMPVQVSVRLRKEDQHLHFFIRFYDDSGAHLGEVAVRADSSAPVLRSDPVDVDFGDIALGTCPERLVRFLKPDGTAWPASEDLMVSASEDLMVRSEGDRVHGELTKQASDATGTMSMQVRPTANLPCGSFQDVLTIQPTGSSRSVRLTIRGRVVPRVVVAPSSLYFGDADVAQEPIQRMVLVRRTDGQAAGRLTRFEAPAPLQVEEIAAEKPSPIKQVRVTLPVGKVKEDLRDGQVLLWLEGEAEPVRVGVMIFLRRE